MLLGRWLWRLTGRPLKLLGQATTLQNGALSTGTLPGTGVDRGGGDIGQLRRRSTGPLDGRRLPRRAARVRRPLLLTVGGVWVAKVGKAAAAAVVGLHHFEPSASRSSSDGRMNAAALKSDSSPGEWSNGQRGRPVVVFTRFSGRLAPEAIWLQLSTMFCQSVAVHSREFWQTLSVERRLINTEFPKKAQQTSK